MKTVQITLDDELVRDVDEMLERLGTTRSTFTREALRWALEAIPIEVLEDKHRRGYEQHPVSPRELGDWQAEQLWPD